MKKGCRGVTVITALDSPPRYTLHRIRDGGKDASCYQGRAAYRDDGVRAWLQLNDHLPNTSLSDRSRRPPLSWCVLSRCDPRHRQTPPCGVRAGPQERGMRECTDMRIAMTAVVLIASMLVSSNGAKSYDATSAYSTCQVDALQGHHDAINGDCPNWEAWRAGHGQAARPAAGGYAASAASPRQRVYPTSRRHVYPTSRSRYH